MLGRARGVVPIMRHELALTNDVACLGQSGRLAVETLDAFEGGVLQPQQLMMDGQEMLTHNVQARFRQKMMDVGDAAHQRIFHWDDAEIAITAFYRVDRVLEAR